MLTDEQLGKFKLFRVRAMGEKAREICEDPAYDSLGFEEKVGLMIDAEVEARAGRKLEKLRKAAALRDPGACVEEVVWLPERKISKDRVERLASCRWVDEAGVVILASKTGGGKTYLAQALANAAVRSMRAVRYVRMRDLIEELEVARSKGAADYYEALDAFKRVELLVLDDFLTTPITARDSVDLFEIVEARDGRRATLVASQLEPHEWYLRIEGELMADSILNRLATGATYIKIEGPNMRKWLAEHPDRIHG